MSEKITKAEYYRMKAENAELKLQAAEREHEREMHERAKLMDLFVAKFGCSPIMGGYTHNTWVVLNSILHELRKDEIPLKAWKGES